MTNHSIPFLRGAAFLALLSPLAWACDTESQTSEASDPVGEEPVALRARVLPSKAGALRSIPADLTDARVVVKFREGTAVRRDGGSLRTASTTRLSVGSAALDIEADVRAVEQAFSGRGMQLRPLFDVAAPRLASLRSHGQRRTTQQLADLSLYFDTAWTGGSAAELSSLLDSLNALSSVEIAYVQPKPELADAAPPDASTPDLSGQQGYVDDDGEGINIYPAHALPGGRGENVAIIDVEGSWVEDHEDLPPPFFHGGTDFVDQAWEDHGTAVAGVLVGQDNGFGVTGIVPDATIGYSGINGITSAQAIAAAAAALEPGDIILIELHAQGPTTATCTCNFDECNFVPMEWFPAEFDAIQTATANGIIVVEAGGNGSIDLDDPAYGGAFDRNQRDSGAIMVGASVSWRRGPTCYTSHGARIDLHAWGQDVVTTGYGDAYVGTLGARDEYTRRFSGTSSASPVVAGAVAALQSIAIERGEGPLTAAELRDLLVETGLPQDPMTTESLIGPLPDVGAAIQEAGWDDDGGDQASFDCDLNGAQPSHGGFGIHNAGVTNIGTAAVTGWSIDIDFGVGIPQPGWIWGATYSVSGNVVTVSGTQTLQPGQTVYFGMGGNYSGPTQLSLSCE